MYSEPSQTSKMEKQSFVDVRQIRRFQKCRSIHRKTLVSESLFNKVVNLQICNFIEKRLQHRCFPVNIAESLRKHFFITYGGCF